MPTTKNQALTARLRLLSQIKQLAQAAIYGSLSETYRRCGNPNCRCHHGGPKHGPHLYISYRGKTGKTTGYYVPHYAEFRSAKESTPGPNSRIACENLRP